MLFKEYHIPMIRSGSKTVTRREWAENYHGPNVGTVVAAKTDLSKPDDECDCFIRVTGKREEYLGEITEASACREGDYDGVEAFREGYEEVYGKGSWSDDKQVTVVEFEYVGKSRPSDATEQTQLVTDGGQPDAEADRRIMSNAGRCDICGETIDMRDAGDELTLVEYGDLDDQLKEEHGLTDQDAIDAVADAMERVAESGAGYELAKVIREEGDIRVHKSCLDETNYSMLETEVPDA